MRKFWLMLFALLIQGIVRLVLLTCRIRVEGSKAFVDFALKNKCILMLWHNRLAIAPYLLFKYTDPLIFAAFVSKSRDGDLLAAVVHTYRRGKTIRVPHNGRHQALKEVIKRLNEDKEVVIITPDGPRGPRYQVKPGIIHAALEASSAIIPLSWNASRFWQLNTWDKLIIPKPFSLIHARFGDPIYLTHTDHSKEILEESLEKEIR